MSVEQLPSGRWRARWITADGRHVGKTFDLKAEAVAHDAEIKKERAQRRRRRPYTGHTIEDALYGHFKRMIDNEKWAPKTRETNESAWKHITSAIGHVRVDHLDVADVERFQFGLLKKLRVSQGAREGLIDRDEAALLQEKLRHEARGKWKLTDEEAEFMDEARSLGLGLPMTHRTMAVLSAGLNYAIRMRWISENVVGLADDLPQKDYQVKDAVAPFAVEAIRRGFLQNDDLESVALLAFMQLAGERPQEALGHDLTVLDGDLVQIYQANKGGVLGVLKNRRNRVVPKISALSDDVGAWIKVCGHTALVFEEDGGPWPPQRYRYWREEVYYPVVHRVFGELIRPYDLGRHAFVALQLAAGRPIAEIALEAGHTPSVLLDHYALVIPEFRSRKPVPAER